MSIENTPVDVPDDLDAFNDLFHGKTPEEAAPADDGPQGDPTDVDATPLEGTPVDDGIVDPEDDGLAETKEPVEKPKSKVEKRIEQLLEKERLANERAAAAEAKLREKEAEATKAAPAQKVEADTSKAPHYDDKNEDGTDKYPLGQFDPQYAEDRLEHTLATQLKAHKEALEAEREQESRQKAAAAAQEAWNAKLAPVQERNPDFQEKGQELIDSFVDLDPAYGEYLTNTIMSMEHGPDVLYHLASNIDEANRIVAMGPLGATLALGRIEAGFLVEQDKQTSPRKVTKAPTPPPVNKGAAVSVPDVPDDTEDLDAFEAKFFKGSRR